MNVFLWIIAGLLALLFLAAGAMKLTQSKEKLATSGQGWSEGFSNGMITTIGALEILAAIGLILPPAVGVAPVFAPLAALGLVLLMIGAAATHLRRNERPNAAVNLVLMVLALVVVWGRFGPHSFTS